MLPVIPLFPAFGCDLPPLDYLLIRLLFILLQIFCKCVCKQFVVSLFFQYHFDLFKCQKHNSFELFCELVNILNSVESRSKYGQRTAIICLKDVPTPRKYPRAPGTPSKLPLWGRYSTSTPFSLFELFHCSSFTGNQNRSDIFKFSQTHPGPYGLKTEGR